MDKKENRFYFNLETGMCEYTIHITNSTMPNPHIMRILYDKEGNILPAKVGINNVAKQLFNMNNEPCYLMKLDYNRDHQLVSVRFQSFQIDYVDECLVPLDEVLIISSRDFKIVYQNEVNLIKFGKEFSPLEYLNKEISMEDSKVRITPEKLIRNYVLLYMKK